VPAPMLQLAGSAYLLRATAWEHYGRYVSIFC
jgi:anaphase-promoting complex subunit 5